MDSRLSPLQRDLIDGFFQRETCFFLTGGAALAGFHLGHRTTEDLDLFTTVHALDDGDRALRETAQALGAIVESLRTSPTFRRRLVRRGDESVVVDLVLDESPQGEAGKERRGSVVLDSAEEILANKLCTILARAEVRDIVDVLFLERAGHRAEQGLPLAARKDGGVSAAQLAWILSAVQIGDDARIPAGVSAVDLRRFIKDLESRFAVLARPGERRP